MRGPIQFRILDRNVSMVAYPDKVDLDQTACRVRESFRWELCQKLLQDKNKRLFGQNWRSLSTLFVSGAGEEQRPPQRAPHALIFQTCLCKSTAKPTTLLRTWVAISSQNPSFCKSLQAHARMANRLCSIGLSFRTPTSNLAWYNYSYTTMTRRSNCFVSWGADGIFWRNIRRS